MAEWEITTADGTTYEDSGRAAVSALLAADKVAGTDLLFDRQNNSRLTVMEYLDRPGPAAVAARTPDKPVSPPPPPLPLPVPAPPPVAAVAPDDDRIPRAWWLAGISAVVLTPLLAYGLLAAFAPAPPATTEPAATETAAGATAATGTRAERGTDGEADGETRERPSPVAVGEVHEVEIISVGSRGDGMAKIEGLSIFVPGVKKGDTVKVRITRIGPRSAQAEVVR